MTTTTPTYRAWQRLPRNILGSTLFSLGMCARVPYFATVLPHVTELEPGRCTVRAPKWWGVHNHIGTFHAIAACNLAAAAMGMLAEATVPSSHRWIPKEMHTRYLTKANSGLTAVAALTEIPDFESIVTGTDLLVPVSLVDRDGTEVVHADITVWITPASPAK